MQAATLYTWLAQAPAEWRLPAYLGEDVGGDGVGFDLASASRIQVLRGPFSALYGNASGGVIALFSKPVRERRFEVGLDAGSAGLRAQLRDRLLDFLARRKHRTSVSDEFVASRTDTHKKAGVFYGQW